MRIRVMWAVVMAAALVAAVGLGRWWPRSSDTTEPVVAVALQGLREGAPSSTLHIPAAYFPRLVGWWEPYMPRDSAPQASGSVAEVQLWAIWPEMQGRDKNNARRFEDPRHSTLWIYIRAVPWSNNNGTLDLESAMSFEMQKALMLVTGELKLDTPTVRGEPRYGLEVLGPTTEQLVPERLLTYQLLRPIDGTSSTFLVCLHEAIEESQLEPSGSGAGLNPHCEHYFASPDLNSIVKVDYRRAHLPEWRTIEQRTHALLTGFSGTTRGR